MPIVRIIPHPESRIQDHHPLPFSRGRHLRRHSILRKIPVMMPARDGHVHQDHSQQKQSHSATDALADGIATCILHVRQEKEALVHGRHVTAAGASCHWDAELCTFGFYLVT